MVKRMNPYKTVNESYLESVNPSPIAPSTAQRRQIVSQQPNTKPSIVYDIDSLETFEKILKDFPIVVVDVWAAYCNPCKMLMPKYEMIARKFEGHFRDKHIIFLKDNIEMNVNIHKPLVTVVPTFFMYVNGKRYHISDFREMEVTIQSALNDVFDS